MKVVVLISGRGSNLRAILDSPVGQSVAAVISDNQNAGGLAIARARKVPTHLVAREINGDGARFESELDGVIGGYEPCLAVLAGFMAILKTDIVRRRKIVNIHPSLLPAYPGLDTHRRALTNGAREHGCTVHWVGEKVDGGDIIEQRKVPVLPGDTEESLAARVLMQEHELYPQVIARLLAQ